MSTGEADASGVPEEGAFQSDATKEGTTNIEESVVVKPDGAELIAKLYYLPLCVFGIFIFLAGRYVESFSAWLWMAVILLHLVVWQRRNDQIYKTNVLAERQTSYVLARKLEQMEETAEWVNELFLRSFRVYRKPWGQYFIDVLQPLLDYYKPPSLSELYFTKFDLGLSPLRILKVRHYRKVDAPLKGTDFDTLQFEMDVVWPSDAEAIILCRLGVVPVPIILNSINIEGTIRIQLTIGKAGFAKVTHVSFMGRPKIDLSIKAAKAMDVMGVPGIESWLHDLIVDGLADYMSWPNRYTYDVEDYGIPDVPKILEVKIIEAKDLMAMDSNGLSDPYALLVYGEQQFKTRTIATSLNPTWNQTFEFEVTSNTLSDLRVRVFDADTYTADSPMGEAVVLLTDQALLDGDRIAKWVDLANCESGRVRLQMYLRDVDQDLDNDGEADSKSGTFHVTLVRGKQLQKHKGRIQKASCDPYVTLTLEKPSGNHQIEQSQVISKNADPSWNQSFKFAINDFFKDQVFVRVFDKELVGKSLPIGDCCLSIVELCEGPNEEFDTWLKLDNVATGELMFRTRWEPDLEAKGHITIVSDEESARVGKTSSQVQVTEVAEEIWENQRKTAHYSSKFLAITDPPAWSEGSSGKNERRRKDEVVLPEGWQWTEAWRVDKANGDVEGWQYAFDFPSRIKNYKFVAKPSAWKHFVRRRRWVRTRRQTTSGATVASPPPSPSPPSPSPSPSPEKRESRRKRKDKEKRRHE